MPDNVLKVQNLCKYFETSQGPLHAVDDVSFNIKKGSTLGLVGESGCGKSTTGRVILNLLKATKGDIVFKGENITNFTSKEMIGMRRKMQIVFQDPFASLNPRMSVSEIISEPLQIHKTHKGEALNKRVQNLMEIVGLASRLTNTYPHELDGGRRQRIGIARALALDPEFIVQDEPVSALDVSIQAQILNLMSDLQEEFGLTYLFISHDLSVVKHVSDEIAVMYLGKIVEMSDHNEIFKNPKHPYTQALLSAIPVPKLGAKKDRIILEGDVPSPISPPPGCRFYGRCIHRMDVCKNVTPELREVGGGGSFVSCHLENSI